jgi:hypothetical protein
MLPGKENSDFKYYRSSIAVYWFNT